MRLRFFVLLLHFLFFTSPAFAQVDLEAEFRDPPPAAWPRTWWHWTGGNVTQEGIAQDLEWMKRAGLGGFQLSDVSFGRGQQVEPKIEFGTPEWLDAVQHAASESERLKLEMTMFSSAGWSLAGGPWVEPRQAMKKLVWSETTIIGPQSFHDKLLQPPSCNGPFLNWNQTTKGDAEFYGDSRVVAFRAQPQVELSPRSLSSGPALDWAALADGDFNTRTKLLPDEEGGMAWIEYRFENPIPLRAITLAASAGIPVGKILGSSDGASFDTLVTLPGAQLYRQGRVRTFSFPVHEVRVVRIEFTSAPLGPAETISQAPTKPAKVYELREIAFHTTPRIHRWEEKACFSHLFEYDSVPTPPLEDDGLAIGEVIDLTEYLAPDGTLTWQAPPGEWTVLRLGYSLTGAKNRPVAGAALGYEVDKLSGEHVASYYQGFITPLKEALGPLLGTTFSHLLLDSWEAGQQNWSEHLLEEFRERRGYDPTPYLPALVGRVVISAEVSDRFLWDFRRTIAEMIATNFYGTMDRLCDVDGLETYSEASGVSLEIPEDTLLNKSKVDVPMGEFWFRDLHPRLMYWQDVRGAASAAHVYGKPIVATESFTGGGYESPAALKEVVEYWFAQGTNRIIFHTSAHQPLDTKPGNTMVGTHFNRNITWAEDARPFVAYLARASHLLQQGRFVADVAYLLPDGAPSTMQIWGAGLTPPLASGYDFDYLNTDVLLNQAEVDEEGRITLPSGMAYRLLVLPENESMRPEVAARLTQLVAAGATISGPRPTKSPSLKDYPNCDAQLQRFAEQLWGDLDGRSRTLRQYGLGHVSWGLASGDLLQRFGVSPDFQSDAPLDGQIAWLHRRTDESEIYYVANVSPQARRFTTRFRIVGRLPKVWHPDTGKIELVSYRQSEKTTEVSLNLAAHDAAFVVFREPTEATEHQVAQPKETKLLTLAGPWRVEFPAGWGAPKSVELLELGPWTEHPEQGVKYFSGTATYRRHFTLEAPLPTDAERVVLDLGDVKDLATVSINGTSCPLVWHAPYRVDVTELVRPGSNELAVAVTNEWTNRIAGDRQPDAAEHLLDLPPLPERGFGSRVPDPVPAGLLGPVRLLQVSNANSE